jgi:hypothetical protein
MSTMTSPSVTRVARVLGVLVLLVTGCGLISSDVTKLTFDLPTKHYTFSADGWASMIPAGVNMKVTCGAGGTVATCPSPLLCDAGVCSAHVPVSVFQKMDLKMEVPQLSSVNNQSLADITLESMTYQVTSTANVPIPEIDLYLAPDGVTDPSNPQAVKFGTIAAIPAATNRSGSVVKTADADATFIKYGMAFGTPFNFIASTTVVVPTGTSPTGMVDVVVNGQVSAKLSL